MPTSHYEVYEADGGQWALCARFAAQDEAVARARAETTWAESRIPTVLIEESLPDSSGQIEIKDIYRSPGIAPNVTAPDVDGNMSGRMAMVAINGLIVGGLVAGIGAVALATSPARGVLTLLIFLLVSAGAMMVLFRMMVPIDVMLWRNKSSESKQDHRNSDGHYQRKHHGRGWR
ncbi:MAG: hypothetical protein EXR11_02245 [Rhodospirillaceae bacterium]|nr:hypothetical protein [Rhodospirillaceae bacterium]